MIRAVYPGSFDPITNGHADIIRRAAMLFDEVIVCIMVNVNKRSLFTVEERKAFINKVFKDVPNVKVDCYDGLLTEYVQINDCATIIKGLRNAVDFEYETNMEYFNRYLVPGVETVYLVSDPEYVHISSSAIKELVSFGSSVAPFVPADVEKALKVRICCKTAMD